MIALALLFSINQHVIIKPQRAFVVATVYMPGKQVSLRCHGKGLAHNEFGIKFKKTPMRFVFPVTGPNREGACVLKSSSKMIVLQYFTEPMKVSK